MFLFQNRIRFFSYNQEVHIITQGLHASVTKFYLLLQIIHTFASMKYLIFLIAIPLAVFISCQSAVKSKQESSITVFCAAGISPAINELIQTYNISNSNKIRLNIGSSGTLARQFEQGNIADIYISANTKWADYIEGKGFFTTNQTLCQNSLVFIAPINSPLDSFPLAPEIDPTSLFKGYLSMGDPDHVPAGEYALQTLVSLQWDHLLSDRILPAQDVRAALIPVEMGECELGIVYYSEAIASKKVKIVAAIPDSLHNPIQFQALLSKNANLHAQQFYQRMFDPTNIALWEKYGFSAVY